ncbi:MAG: hypothetical protein L0332_28205 [Chloroflexi bacterium]|nr:hypothetical protein [Chloroflexota bacterium]MCI0643856.1 hypothetical protein [Chloroflexota bacterium]MCI0730581.1 hypothetical protein [Chloroflexota bacterium]
MNGRVVPLGFLALFLLFVLLPFLAACEDYGTPNVMAAATQTIAACWTSEANATLTAATAKDALTETAVWAGETATTIAFMTEVWGTPTPSATATPNGSARL